MRRDVAALLLVPMLTFLPVTGALMPAPSTSTALDLTGAATTLPLTGAASGDEPTPAAYLGARVFVLVMIGHTFNFQTWPDSPLLEAYVGESLQFVVHVPEVAEMHTFHVHGHPWLDQFGTGEVIDTVLLPAGETHLFDVVAGLDGGYDGDWFYHCHVDSHFDGGMWGLLRIYPYAMGVTGNLATGLDVALDRLGQPLDGASFAATLGGVEVPLASEAKAGEVGTTTVKPLLPEGARGELVLTAHHPELGRSVARLDLDGQGGYALLRHEAPPDAVAMLPEDVRAGLPAALR